MSPASLTRRIRVGVVGCGVVATAYYLPYLIDSPGVELTAVCDTNRYRTEACVRLFGAQQQYQDYYQMIEQASIDAVLILTGPGTHVPFTLAAATAGKHILVQKPMALTMQDTNAIVDTVRRNGVKAVIEPSSNTLLEPAYQELRALLDLGVLGDPYWFSLILGSMDRYHPSLGGNPYGLGAFYSEDSGGMLFDFPYAPSQIVALLGPCKSVTGLAKISVPERDIVPDIEYDRFLARSNDPHDTNYWDAVLDLQKTEHVTMGAPDNVFSLYEMVSGATGVFHVGRPFHPVPKGFMGGLHVYGTAGNLFMDNGGFASIITSRKDLLPHVDADGWYRIPVTGDTGKAKWPQPLPGGFNYYHESTRHLIECIIEDRDPVVNVEWGRHINEMMVGAIESSRTGQRYLMTSTPTGLIY